MSDDLIGKVQEPEQLQPGTYQAQVIGIEKKVLQFGPVLEFNFKLLDAEEGVRFDTVKGIADFKDNIISRGGKLHLWLSRIAGKEIDVSTTVDCSKFVGMSCEVLVANKPGKNGKVFSNVKEVVPSRKKKAEASAPPPQSQIPASTPPPTPEPKPAPKKVDDFEF